MFYGNIPNDFSNHPMSFCAKTSGQLAQWAVKVFQEALAMPGDRVRVYIHTHTELYIDLNENHTSMSQTQHHVL